MGLEACRLASPRFFSRVKKAGLQARGHINLIPELIVHKLIFTVRPSVLFVSFFSSLLARPEFPKSPSSVYEHNCLIALLTMANGKKAKGGKKGRGGKRYSTLDDDGGGGRNSNRDNSKGAPVPMGKGGQQKGSKKGSGGQANQGRGGKKGKRGQIKTGGAQGYDDDDFRRTLVADGNRTIREMESDGNCLFRSLSDQLHGDRGDRHAGIRSDVCDYLAKSEEEFGVFLLLDDDEAEDVAEFDTYVDRMREDGEWGGNVELVAASRLYRRSITVFCPTGAFSIENEADNKRGDRVGDGGKLLLSYHDKGHYNSVRDERVQKIRREKSRSGTKVPESNVKDTTKGELITGELSTAGSAVGDSQDDKILNNRTAAGKVGGNVKEKPLDTAKRKGRAQIQEQQPKRNDACPCGSGLRYKKCCLTNEKRKARLSKFQSDHGLAENSETAGEGSGGGTEPGDFKVLKI